MERVQRLIDTLIGAHDRLVKYCDNKKKKKRRIGSITSKLVSVIETITVVSEEYRHVWSELVGIATGIESSCKQIICAIIVLVYVRNTCLTNTSNNDFEKMLEGKIGMLIIEKRTLLKELREIPEDSFGADETREMINDILSEVELQISSIQDNVQDVPSCRVDTVWDIVEDVKEGSDVSLNSVRDFISANLPYDYNLIKLFDMWTL